MLGAKTWSADYLQSWPPTWSDTRHSWSKTKRAPLTAFERGALSFSSPRLHGIMGGSSSSWAMASSRSSAAWSTPSNVPCRSQRGMAERNASVAEEDRFNVRIGINIGEVIVDGDDRYGEGVNVAARLEQLAPPGGIYVSGKVAKEVEKKLAFALRLRWASRRSRTSKSLSTSTTCASTPRPADAFCTSAGSADCGGHLEFRQPSWPPWPLGWRCTIR